jgi:hypothetical protein
MRVFAGLLILALSPIAVCSAAEVKPDPCQGITSGPDLTKESNPTTRNPVLWDPKSGDRSLTVAACLVVGNENVQPTSPGTTGLVSPHGLSLGWNVALVDPKRAHDRLERRLLQDWPNPIFGQGSLHCFLRPGEPQAMRE